MSSTAKGHQAAGQRLDRRVRRLPEAVSRGHRRQGRGRGGRRRQPHAAADERARSAQAAEGGRQPAFHPAAAALLRSQPGQEDGGTGHRPPVHLRLDPVGAAGSQLREAGQAALRAGGPRPAGDRLPGQLLRALRRYRLHRRPGGKARRDFRRLAGLAQGDARLLGGILQGGGADPRPEDQRRHQCAGPGPGAAFLPGA